MELKKTPKADVGKKRTMYMALGLIISLSLTLYAFEAKQYEEGELMVLNEQGEEVKSLAKNLGKVLAFTIDSKNN